MSKLYFATNRNLKEGGGSFGTRFHADGPQVFRVGTVDVNLKEGLAALSPEAQDDAAWEVANTTLYGEDFDTDREGGPQLGSAEMFESLRSELNADCDVILFIHGFNNDFEDAARRAGQLNHIYQQQMDTLDPTNKRRVVTFFFSWPSDGRAIASPFGGKRIRHYYYSDRDDAEMSGAAMARALERLVAFIEGLRAKDIATIRQAMRERRPVEKADIRACQSRLHLVAHSMGNYALRYAVQYFRKKAGSVPRLVDNAFLMAADEDQDALSRESKLAPLFKLAKHVHVYYTDQDYLLDVSDLTKGNPERLGSEGPKHLDEIDGSVTAIDCSKVSDTGLTHGDHQYYRLREEVVKDVVRTLKGEPQDWPDRNRSPIGGSKRRWLLQG
ncbi:MAG: alpha/beta hydrolase [Rhodobacteraceae bacterium]|nr:alpha/beta hydrolase [Paracoccaceae bacterium]